MRIDYPSLIPESEADLAALERSLRGSPLQVRITMLRLLKTSVYVSQGAIADTLGYSARQCRRWWKAYERNGLDALLEFSKGGGSQERLSLEARNHVSALIQAGRLHRLEDVQTYLHRVHGIKYQSLQGVSDALKRHQIERRTAA
ncbi:MAG: hypothetical protein RhofKO_24950 [Rhodothermales bacterium]